MKYLDEAYSEMYRTSHNAQARQRQSGCENNMKVSFLSTYMSIEDFPEIDLPDFVVLTGENGAGKTHFLQALSQRCLYCNIAQVAHQDIKYFEWQNFIPRQSGQFNSETLREETNALRQALHEAKTVNRSVDTILSIARSNGMEWLDRKGVVLLYDISVGELSARLGPRSNAKALKNQILEVFAQVDSDFLSHIPHQFHEYLKKIADNLRVPVAFLTDEDISSYKVPNWGNAGIFQQSFGRLFGVYRDARLKNDIAELNFNKGRSSSKALSDVEFEALYGPTPWDFVNTILSEANLDFCINQPDLDDFTAFTPQLSKKLSGIQIPFDSLSSGEKVLVSFAFCVYYASDNRQLSVYPKLILLDEVDAPLHPSMSKTVVDTIVDTLVGKFGLKVILATHSPSTVAVSPESAIYVMEKGKAGLRKTSKSQALNILTYGVPTIAISYDGRRQVFVESPADAETYGEIYRILKNRLKSSRSLEFIATGTRSSTGVERNTGCDIVRRLVAELSGAGNISVFGLLDWDGRHNPTDRIAVLAHGRRNGLENVIFDPLLIILLICRDGGQHKSIIGLSHEIRYHNVAVMGQATLQRLVNKICELVLGDSNNTAISTEYAGGLVLNVDRRWFLTDDHALESMILGRFPFLRAITKNQAGKLMQHIVSNIIADYPDLIPTEAVEALQYILDADAHPLHVK